jgi:hypothetical protein
MTTTNSKHGWPALMKAATARAYLDDMPIAEFAANVVPRPRRTEANIEKAHDKKRRKLGRFEQAQRPAISNRSQAMGRTQASNRARGARQESSCERRCADVRITRALGASFHLHIARTVLSALREPTLSIVEAARTQIDDAGKWRAMVDAALREFDGI